MLDENYLTALLDYSKNFLLDNNVKSFNITRIRNFNSNYKDSMEFLKNEFGELKDIDNFIDYSYNIFKKLQQFDIEKLDLHLNKENHIIFNFISQLSNKDYKCSEKTFSKEQLFTGQALN